MSLSRYTNETTIKTLNIPQYGQLFTEDDIKNLTSKKLIPALSSIDTPTGKLVTELHIYTFNGDYLGSTYDTDLELDRETNGMFIDIRQVFTLANITKGSYKVIFNLISPVFGRPTSTDPAELDWPVFIREVAPLRDELKLTIRNTEESLAINKFKTYIEELTQLNMLNNLVINFGQNNVYKVINLRYDKRDPNIFYVKLYN